MLCSSWASVWSRAGRRCRPLILFGGSNTRDGDLWGGPRAALFAPAALLVGSLSARQRSAGEALRKSEQRYRDYIETLSDWLWEIGLDHRFTQISVLGFEGQRRVGEQRQDFATDVEEEPEKWRS
jgi:PAS domain-containing protein